MANPADNPPDKAPVPPWVKQKDELAGVYRALFPDAKGNYKGHGLANLLLSALRHIAQKGNAVISPEEMPTLFGVTTAERAQVADLAKRLEEQGFAHIWRDRGATVLRICFTPYQRPESQEVTAALDPAEVHLQWKRKVLVAALKLGDAAPFSRDALRGDLTAPDFSPEGFEKAFAELVSVPASGMPFLLTFTIPDGALRYLPLARLPHTLFRRLWDPERERVFEKLVEECLWGDGKVPALSLKDLDPIFYQCLEVLIRSTDMTGAKAQTIKQEILTVPLVEDPSEWNFLSSDDLIDRTLTLYKNTAPDGQGQLRLKMDQLLGITPGQVTGEVRRRAGGSFKKAIFSHLATRVKEATTPEAIDKALESRIWLFFGSRNLTDYLRHNLERLAEKAKERMGARKGKPLFRPLDRNAKEAPVSASAPAGGGMLEKACEALGLTGADRPESLDALPALLEDAMREWANVGDRPKAKRDEVVADITRKIQLFKKRPDPSRADIRELFNNLQASRRTDSNLKFYIRLIKYTVVQVLCS